MVPDITAKSIQASPRPTSSTITLANRWDHFLARRRCAGCVSPLRDRIVLIPVEIAQVLIAMLIAAVVFFFVGGRESVLSCNSSGKT